MTHTLPTTRMRTQCGTMTIRQIAITVGLVLLLSPPLFASSLAELYRQVDPSVVVVLANHISFDPAAHEPWVEACDMGSGFLIDDTGIIVTAAHVVGNADSVNVTFRSGETMPAAVRVIDPGSDLALLLIESVPDGVIPVELGRSDTTAIGDEVFIVASPMGAPNTLSSGHVSARRSGNPLFDPDSNAELLQTDAVVAGGSSGGPMFDMEGRVIGIITSGMSSRGRSTDGIGFAVAVESLHTLLDSLGQPWFGVSGTVLTDKVALGLNLPQSSGFLVESVWPGSPAERLGVQGGELRAVIEEALIALGGDVILEIQGTPLPETDIAPFVAEMMFEAFHQESLTITLLRNGTVMTLSSPVASLTDDRFSDPH